MKLKLTGKRTVIAIALVAGVGVLYVQGKDEQHTKQGPTSTETVACRIASTEDGVREACDKAADGTNPPSDLNGDADYRRHLAKVLTRRAVLAAAGG